MDSVSFIWRAKCLPWIIAVLGTIMGELVMKKTVLLLLAMAVVSGGTAFSAPILQIYIEGATYDSVTETWVYAPEGSSPAGGASIRLWAIGNVAGPGVAGPISDVKLSIAYSNGISPMFEITGSQINSVDYSGWNDLSVPENPAWIQTNTSGQSPIMGDGSRLPRHGIYGSGVTWQEFLIGDMTLTDSPVGDFIRNFPSLANSNAGQINVYDIAISNVQHGNSIHFDLYDHVGSDTDARFVFAPFSHDADGQVEVVPEPSALLLLGTGMCAMAFYARSRRRK
jgi:hypothetical protein